MELKVKSTTIPISTISDFYPQFCGKMKTSPLKDKFIDIYSKILNEECRYFNFARINGSLSTVVG